MNRIFPIGCDACLGSHHYLVGIHQQPPGIECTNLTIVMNKVGIDPATASSISSRGCPIPWEHNVFRVSSHGMGNVVLV